MLYCISYPDLTSLSVQLSVRELVIQARFSCRAGCVYIMYVYIQCTGIKTVSYIYIVYAQKLAEFRSTQPAKKKPGCVLVL